MAPVLHWTGDGTVQQMSRDTGWMLIRDERCCACVSNAIHSEIRRERGNMEQSNGMFGIQGKKKGHP